MNPRKFFTLEQQNAIEQAIEDAEKLTSGEIRLHIDKECKGDPIDCAIEIFKKLEMDKTELRNGVLFYLSIDDRKFAIIGDKGINEKVSKDFWDNIHKTSITYFQQQKFTEGLTFSIFKAGRQLAKYFPIQSNDTNELTNKISFEKETENE